MPLRERQEVEEMSRPTGVAAAKLKPGAEQLCLCLQQVIRDRPSRFCVLVHARFTLKADMRLDRSVPDRIETGLSAVIQVSNWELRIMCCAITDHEWAAIRPMLPNKPRGVPRVNDRRVLNRIFWVLRSGAPR
jgi:hypothetical protein